MIEKAAGAPSVTEVPAIMTIGGMYTGGSRRKSNTSLDFDTLKQFSVVYDVARACINHRKRQIENLEWSIVPKDDEADSANFKKQIATITTFFEEPCHNVDFKSFNDRIIEDLLVFDAAVLWKDRTYGGGIKELLPVDGATIRIKVAEDGTLPEAPEVAYQQILNGKIEGEYTVDEMYYKIMNPRNSTPYGLGPLEGLIIGVDSALRSQMYNLTMLQEGTVPEGFYGVPPEWTPDQIKDYQLWFDTIMAGGQGGARIKFMPGGKGVGYMPTKKQEDMRFVEFEKWLLMKTCALFDVQPRDIGFEQNAQPGNAGSQQELGNQRGLVPMANFLKQIYTEVIRKDFGMPDLKFEWKGLQVIDDEFELKRAEMMIKNGAMTINEQRVAQGMEPFEDEIADKPMIYTTGGPVLLEVVANEAEQALVPKELVPATGAGTDPNADPGAKDGKKPQDGSQQATEDAGAAKLELMELEKWETKAQNFLKRGKGANPPFQADHIDRAVHALIGARLSVCKSNEEITAAFKPFVDDAQERELIDRALTLKGDISAHKRTKYETAGSRTG